MTAINYLRGNPLVAGEYVNDFFEKLGHGRPINAWDVNGHISAVFIDGQLRGAAYAATATSIADALFSGHYSLDGVVTAMRFHSLEALAIHPDCEGNEYNTHLLESIADHARRDFGADYLLARLGDAEVEWYARRQFTVCGKDERLTVNGVPLPASEGYLDSWRSLLRAVPAVSTMSKVGVH